MAAHSRLIWLIGLAVLCADVANALQLPQSIARQSVCSASSPCEQGCCSQHGSCGFGPEFCGTGCQGTCNAKAECGMYATAGNERCPLDVCCSQWGFCGTTEEFCDSKCQSGCGSPTRPSCGPTSGSSDGKTIGYYESWSYQRPGCSWPPENINAELLTHINYAFALVGDDYRIAAMNPFDAELYHRTVALKKNNPSLKVSIAVGGWSASGPPFSNMAQSRARRAIFIQSVIDLMNTFGFDGIDLDWEYPVAPDRDGRPEDKANYVRLVAELRRALGPAAEISVAIPASFWYLQNFDLAGMAEHVSWFNMMTYDIHGTWDGNSKWTQSVVQPHTNLTEIDDGMDLLWRSGVPPRQVVLGLGFYGRSFALADPSCTSPMCPFSGGADPGSCVRTSGVLSNAEIQEVIRRTGVTPEFNLAAGVKWISWDGQWVSYDDADTLAVKKRFANNRCLGGTMIWAVDLDEPGSPTLRALAAADGNTPDWIRNLPAGAGVFFGKRRLEAIAEQEDSGLSVLITKCSPHPYCPPGFRELTAAKGQWSYMGSTADACPLVWGRGAPDHRVNPNRRLLCIENDVEADGCAWVGKPLFCQFPNILRRQLNACPPGSIHLANNNQPPNADAGADTCFPGTMAAFCCKSIKVSNQRRPCDEFDRGNAILAGGVAGGVSEDNALGRQRRRLGELQDGAVDTIPHQDVGNRHACLLRRGLAGDALLGGMVLFVAINRGCARTVTLRERSTSSTTVTKPCDFAEWEQACAHYKSAASVLWTEGLNRLANGADELLCPDARPPPGLDRWIPDEWNKQHRGWLAWVPKTPKPNIPGRVKGCQRDEYPFFRLAHGPGFVLYDQLVRVLPGTENNAAGLGIPMHVCNDLPPPTRYETGPVTTGPDGDCTRTVTTIPSQTVLSITYLNNNWDGDPVHEDLLRDNQCLPELPEFNEPGFALLKSDPYYRVNFPFRMPLYDYRDAPPLHVTQGQTPPTRRSASLVDTHLRISEEHGVILVEDRNSSRKATPEELLKHLGIVQCLFPDCRDEKAALGLDVAGQPTLRHTEAASTATLSHESGVAATQDPTVEGASAVISRESPRPEAMVVGITSTVDGARVAEATPV